MTVTNLDKIKINSYESTVIGPAYSSLVMPTCRLAPALAFFKQWNSIKPFPVSHIHIVYDGPSSDIALDMFNKFKSFHPELHIHSWDENFVHEELPQTLFDKLPEPIDYYESKNVKCFSKRDSSIRSYGFLMACAYINAICQITISQNDHVIFTLDDDCFPLFEEESNDITPFFYKHHHNLFKFGSWASTIPGHRVRGVPYYTLGSKSLISNDDMLLSVGLWKGIPDFDAVQRLSIGVNAESTVLPLPEAPILANPNVLYPICGMNMAFKQSMLPVALFAPMGSASPYKRFDDIWFGLFAQFVFKVANKSWCYGPPFINHMRLSKSMDCLKAEAPGIKLNEVLWMYIADAVLNFEKTNNKYQGNSVIEAADYIIKAMSSFKDTANLIFESYDKECTDYISLWCESLSNWLLLIKKFVLNDASITI